jgi:hypothetical protein
MQVAVSPSHDNLKDIVQAIESDTTGYPNAPPNARFAATLSWVEIKPASKGRNDPASGARTRSHEKRGIFLSNKPDINDLVRACSEEKCRLTQILVAGSFRPLLAGL